jgi:hypothetical protein
MNLRVLDPVNGIRRKLQEPNRLDEQRDWNVAKPRSAAGNQMQLHLADL